MMAAYPSKHLEDTILDLLLRWKVESLLKPGLKGQEVSEVRPASQNLHGRLIILQTCSSLGSI